MCDGTLDLTFDILHDLVATILSVFAAYFGGDGEARRNRHAQEIHLCKVGAFAAQEIAHRGVAFCFSISKRIDSFHLVGYKVNICRL